VFVLSMSVDANAARRSALGGNMHIDDADDMFAFPHLLKQYNNSAIIDFAPSNSYPSSMNGRGTVTFGSDSSKWCYQVNTGRADYLDNTAFWAWGGFDRDLDLFSRYLDIDALQWWDLGVATTFGSNNWGLTLSWAADSEKVEPEGVDPTVDNSTSMFSFQIGTDLAGIDWALEFGTGSFKDKASGTTPADADDFGFTTLALAARGRPFRSGGIDWRWTAAFATQSANPKAEGIETFSTTGFRANFGPVWGTPRDFLVSAYIYFDYSTMQEPNGEAENDKYKETYIVFPGYNIAMEYYLTSWFAMRGSIFSHYSMETYKVEGAPAGENGEQKEKYFDAFWTIGMGIDKEAWGLDIALEEEYLHTGYLPFGADLNEQVVLALITAWVRW
jgi:hypothetical protein